jgi:toxin ParE1/3/4
MRGFILAPAAELDIRSILAWTNEHFGEPARLRYEALLIRSILVVANDPKLSGSSSRPEIARAARTYHLVHSRTHVRVETGRVKQPRHFLLYRCRDDGAVEIGRVLHESVDLQRHVPDEYRLQAEGVSDTDL